MQSKKTLDFIEKAKLKHGGYYDYSLVEYNKNNIKVIIVCPTHKKFEQTPANHLHGFGCRDCGISKTAKTKIQKAKKKFVSKAMLKHGNKYNYSSVEYVSAKDKVIIICPIHNKFEQTPSNHLYGFGCNDCGTDKSSVKQRMGYEEFVKKAKEKHGNKFEFHFPNMYKNNTTKITIICPEHGSTSRDINSFLQSEYGCSKCGYEAISEKLSKDTKYFLEKAKETHGDFYDYSSVDYKKSDQPINITCPTHGEFPQTPANHIGGKGCRDCGDKRSGDKQRMDYEEFVKKAKEKHDNKYDYSNVTPNGWDNDIKIICPIHGEFEQRLGSHLCGRGCQRCRESKGEKSITEWFIKKGIKFEIQHRVKQLNCGLFEVEAKQYSYDFYIPKLSLLIEFDGEQHFKPINFSGNIEKMKIAHKESTARDIIKNDIATLNGLDLLRIPYWEARNIASILHEVVYGDRALMLETYSYQSNIDKYESGVLPTDRDL